MRHRPQKGDTQMKIIAFDSHKRYTWASVETMDGRRLSEQRINHKKGAISEFLSQWEKGSPVALETIGNWYWLVDEIEASKMRPRLVHARKAKLMMGAVNKTDKLDARGLNMLQRAGTLPTVWIPPGELRDKRELCRTRMVFASQRTRIKNRIHSVLAKYGLHEELSGVSDIFGKTGRAKLSACMSQLPQQTRYTVRGLLQVLDKVCERIKALEKRMRAVYSQSEEIKLLMTMPGVGFILAVVIWQEIGDVSRFRGPGQLASYSGTCPRIHSSGDRSRYGPLRNDVNHYLKWAFSEAGNSIAVNRARLAERHVGKLYNRLRRRRGHAKAIGAVARHLAEASYWMLSRKECYKERNVFGESPTEA
jgi:transposase